jgi:hypothetical protein
MNYELQRMDVDAEIVQGCVVGAIIHQLVHVLMPDVRDKKAFAGHLAIIGAVGGGLGALFGHSLFHDYSSVFPFKLFMITAGVFFFDNLLIQ